MATETSDCDEGMQFMPAATQRSQDKVPMPTGEEQVILQMMKGFCRAITGGGEGDERLHPSSRSATVVSCRRATQKRP